MKVFVNDLRTAVYPADEVKNDCRKYNVEVVCIENFEDQITVTIFGEELNCRALLEEWEFNTEDCYWIREGDQLECVEFRRPN